MKTGRLVTIFQYLVVAFCVVAGVAVTAVNSFEPSPQPPSSSQVQFGAAGGLAPIALIIMAVAAFRYLGGTSFFVESDPNSPLDTKGSFLSIFLTFVLLFGGTIVGAVAAIEFDVPLGWVLLVSGGLAGGLLGSWAAATWELSTLCTGLGAFLGLSADAGISYAAGSLPKSVLGALAQFILAVSKAGAEALKNTQLPAPSQTAMSLFLWPLALCALIGLGIGVYKKRDEVIKLKQSLAAQSAKVQALQDELTSVREKPIEPYDPYGLGEDSIIE